MTRTGEAPASSRERGTGGRDEAREGGVDVDTDEVRHCLERGRHHIQRAEDRLRVGDPLGASMALTEALDFLGEAQDALSPEAAKALQAQKAG